MSIECVNVNQSETQFSGSYVDNLLDFSKVSGRTWKPSFRFSYEGRDYIFCERTIYYDSYKPEVEALIVDETSCYEGSCQIVSLVNLRNVESLIINAVISKVCDDVKTEGQLKIDPIDSVVYDDKWGIYKISENEFYIVRRFSEQVHYIKGDTEYDYVPLLHSFYVYLIYKISGNQLSLEAVEIPILRNIPEGACIPNYLSWGTDDFKYIGNNSFVFASVTSNEEFSNINLSLYSLDVGNSLVNNEIHQQVPIVKDPSYYGISMPQEYSHFDVEDCSIYFVENSDDLLILEFGLRFEKYNDNTGFDVVNYSTIVFNIVSYNNFQNFVFSSSYTHAFSNNLSQLLQDLLSVSNSYVNFGDYIGNVNFVKVEDKIVMYGAFKYLSIENSNDLGINNRAIENHFASGFEASLVVYDFNQNDLKLSFKEIYFTGNKKYADSIAVYYNYFDSFLPIFSQKTQNLPNGVLVLNSAAKEKVCQILEGKYQISDCEQNDFYFVLKDIDRFYDQPRNSVQIFSDECSFYMITAIRLLRSYEDFHASTNETPIDEYLAIVLFKFSFDEQGNLIKEYRILDVIKLYVVSPGDTYVGRQESVYIPQIFFDNQKRLHYYVYVYRSLPNIGRGRIAAI